ncbi:MAG: hypothetical protein GW947_00845 [Candidatus Pacebacteria bacterium]|nr:hypothetical protein [Candidatus Paceibacterota bacterium]PIR60457.1 MAG: hypothetical protein COU68_02525 [Candidatus Pacebacteria bacterium CG10_big_fil_rev_8_21_14_0_10_45_6]
MISNTQSKSPMPNPIPEHAVNRFVIGVLAAAILAATSFLLYKNSDTVSTLRQPARQMDESDKLPMINKEQSTPSVELAVVEAKEKNTANIMISSETIEQLVDGVELIIHFDPNLVTNVSLKPSQIFSSVVRNTVSAETGVINLAVVRLPDETVTIGTEVTLATITYTPKQPGEITFSFAADGTVVAGNQGDDILKSTKNLTILTK